MTTKSILIALLLTITLVGCNFTSRSEGPTETAPIIPSLEFSQPTSVPMATSTPNQTQDVIPGPYPLPSTQQIVLDRAFLVINALKDQDMAALSQYVHPQMGLHFSPYANVKDSDQVIPAEKVAGLMTDSNIYLWGNYDGSGEPINLTFADYYAKFIYDVDFANAAELSLNHRLGTGNSNDNTSEYYPGSMIVEFYFPGFDPQYQGMDWRSLRLVFMQEGNDWLLVGIIHDQWTI